MNGLNYPLLFEPVYKNYIWGGNRISRRYGRALPTGVRAESWEISDRPEGMSVVTNGRLAGRNLGKLVKEFEGRLVGEGCTDQPFPLLVKIIDSRQRLSVQVHPADENAAAVGGEPKTEMWYVLGAGAGARVFAGFRKAVTQRDFEMAVRSGGLERLLRPVRVKTGDAILIPGGTVHCIDAGLLLLEVQQNSNTTFRVHDWGRAGPNGEKRTLHIAEAMKTVLWTSPRPERAKGWMSARCGKNRVWDIVECRHFRMERLDLAEPFQAANDGRSFHAYFVTRGAVTIRAVGGAVMAKSGVSCLLPAAIDRYTISPAGAKAQVLRISIGTAKEAGAPDSRLRLR